MLEKFPDLKYPNIDPTSQDTFLEFFVNEIGKWQNLKEVLVDWIYPTENAPEFSSIIIPMVDNVRSEYLIDLLNKQ
jgi:dynein heavy chain